MKYIDVYNTQLYSDNKKKESYYNSEIFNEYCTLTCFISFYDRENFEIKKKIKDVIQKLSSKTIKDIETCVETLKVNIAKIEKTTNMFSSVDGVIFLIGDAYLDSHGMLIDDKAYLVVDLNRYVQGMDNYNPISFLYHELSHVIHYKLSPKMYFRNFKNKTEEIIKRIIVEGIATYSTRHYTDESDSDIFWLGHLNEGGIKKWISFSDNLLNEISQDLSNSSISNNYSEEFQIKLFSMLDMNKIWEGRTGYYYGYKIIEEMNKFYSMEEILELDYKEFIPYVNKYFNLSKDTLQPL